MKFNNNMGKIKKILENELVGGTQTTDVYPVTSAKAVYDEGNKRLDDIIKEINGKAAKLEQEVIYDVTANNNGATFESLSSLLGSGNLSTLIPSAIRCGGMTIRFVQSFDNKYVQYRLMSDTFNTTLANWQGVDSEPTAGSDNLVKSGGVAEGFMDAYSSMSISSEGLIPYIVEEDVYILELTGEKSPYKDWGATNFIRVAPNTHIKVRINSVFAKRNKYCWWYDENKQPLSRVGKIETGQGSSLVAGENILHVPEGAYYLRISEELVNIKTMTIESFSKLDTRKQIEELKQHTDDIDFNHSEGYRAFTLFDNYYVRHTGEIKDYAEWVATDKFRVKDKLIVYISESTTYCCFYDANKDFISSFTINADWNSIHIPDNAVYAAISAPKEVMKTLKVKGYFFNKYEESSKQINKNKNKIKEHSSLLNDSIEYDFTDLKNVGKYYAGDSTPNNPTVSSKSYFVGIFDIAADETVKYRCDRIGAPPVYVTFYEGRIWSAGNEGEKEIPVQGFPYQIAFNCHESFLDFYLQITGKEGIVENIEKLNNKISSLNIVDDKDISEITNEIYNSRKEGFYIDKEGNVITYKGYRISTPYPVKKGDIVEFSANGNSITFLAKTKKTDITEGDNVDVIYFSDSSDELKKIRHQFDEDTNMIICWNYTLKNVKLEHPIYISSITPYSDKEKDVIIKMSSLQSQNSIKFILHTDNHCNTNINKVMTLRHCEEYAKLAEAFGLDFHINLGDVFINGSTIENKRNLSEMVLKMQNSFVPFLYVLGNHEVWTGYGELDYNYVYGATGRFNRYISKKYNELDSDKLYYYFDNDIQKVRCYVLNSSSIGYWGFSDLQIEWMSRTIDDMPDGYKIVIFTHIPFFQGAMHSTEKNSKVPVGLPTNSSTLRNMLLGKEGLKIISVINGHMHWDLVVYDDELDCPFICTTSEKFEDVSTQTKWAIPNQLPLCPEREKGNYSEYAADIYNISSTSSTIDILRFGAGKSRKIHLTSVNVTDSVTLTSSLDNPTWRTSSEAIASVLNGVVTKVAIGSTTIQAETDTDVEIWHILVK